MRWTVGIAFLLAITAGCGGGGGGTDSTPTNNGGLPYELAALEIDSGSLGPDFTPSARDYLVGPAPLADNVSIRATPVSNSATLEVDGVGIAAGQWTQPLDLPIGITRVRVRVFANSQSLYTIWFHRTRALTLDTILEPMPWGGPTNKAGFGRELATTDSTLATSSGEDIYVYEHDGSGFTNLQIITDPFGDLSISPIAVALHGDTLVAGSAGLGRVAIFRRTAGQWTREIILPDMPNEDWFGVSVDVWGDRVVVGAPLQDAGVVGVNLMPDVGAAYVYVRTPTGWTLDQYLPSPATSYPMKFGHSVAIHGSRLVVGAPEENGSSPGVNPPGPWVGGEFDSGAAYVFERTTTWNQAYYVKASDVSRDRRFGSSLHLTADSLAVGSPGGNRAYVFRFDSAGMREDARVLPEVRGQGQYLGGEFGTSVSLAGASLVCGAPREFPLDPLRDAGVVHALQLGGAAQSTVEFSQSLSPETGGLYGHSVSHMGSMIVIGAPGEGSPEWDGRIYIWK